MCYLSWLAEDLSKSHRGGSRLGGLWGAARDLRAGSVCLLIFLGTTKEK